MNSGTELVALLCKHEHFFSFFGINILLFQTPQPLFYAHNFRLKILMFVKERIYTLKGLINGKGGDFYPE